MAIALPEQQKSSAEQAQWHPPQIFSKGATPDTLVPGESDQDWSRRQREENGTIGDAFSPSKRIVGGRGGVGRTTEKKGPRKVGERGGKGKHINRQITPSQENH